MKNAYARALSLAAVAVSMAGASAVQAQTASGEGLTYNLFSTTTNSGTFGNNGQISGEFTNVYTFTVTGRGILASDFSNAASRNNGSTDIDFSGATLVGNGTTTDYFKAVGEPLSLTELWTVTPFAVDAGTYTLTLSGRAYGAAATIAGNFNVDLSSGVPEPATWGLMILGFGATGLSLRRRSKARTTVTFA